MTIDPLEVPYTPELTLAKLVDLHRNGKRVLCPKCRAPLLFALDKESAAAAKVSYGVYCSSDHAHLSIHVHFGTPKGFWDQFS